MYVDCMFMYIRIDEVRNLRAMLAMGLAYSANIGGTASLIGTPPNLLLLEVLETFDGQPINFFSWLVLSVPQVKKILIVSCRAF